jgi:fatty acid/phospholipid biosynthesis enzyme
VAIVCHGSSNARAISHAVRAAAKAADSGFVAMLREAAGKDAAREVSLK